jgi:hypothetical protein
VEPGPSRGFGEETSNECNQSPPLSRYYCHNDCRNASAGAIRGPGNVDDSAEASGPRMPEDSVGLSYEVQQLVDPTFFSAENTGLIREFRALDPHGVLRLGGNTSEFEWWKPSPASPEPEHPQTREVVGSPGRSITRSPPKRSATSLRFCGRRDGPVCTGSEWGPTRRSTRRRRRSTSPKHWARDCSTSRSGTPASARPEHVERENLP